MENKVLVSPNDFRFEWKVVNPFLPFNAVKISLDHVSPFPMQWTAKLRPRYRSVEKWGFFISLQCSKEGDDPFVVEAREIKIHVAERERGLDEDVESDRFYFREENDHTFVSRELFISPGTLDLELKVDVRFGDGHTSDVMYLNQFSEDFGKLIFNSIYSDIGLDGEILETPVRVHSCVMRARWPSLLERHREEVERDGEVTLNMKNDVLYALLFYMYEGRVVPPCREEADFVTRFRKAVETYELRHIGQLFLGGLSPAYEVRRTCNNFSTYQREFDVTSVESIHFQFQGHLNRTRFQFSFEMSDSNRDYPLFTYSIAFEDGDRLFVRADIEYHRDGRRIGIVHEDDYFILPHQRVQPGDMPFQGYYPEFKEFLNRFRRREDLTDASHKFVFIIYGSEGVRDGPTDRVEYTTVCNNNANLLMLSEDILRLLHTDTQTNLEVLCGDEIHRVHSAIIAARVPNWRNVLEPLDDEPAGSPADVDPPGSPADVDPPGSPADVDPPGSPADVDPPGSPADVDPPGSPADVDPPGSPADVDSPGSLTEVNPLRDVITYDRMRCSLSKNCFLDILNYIYSGKVFLRNNIVHFDETVDFARRGGLTSLEQALLVRDCM